MDAVSQQVLGVTPFEVNRTADRGLRTLVLRLAGYQERSLQLLMDSSESRRVSLVPLEPVAPASEPAPKKKSLQPKTKLQPTRAVRPGKPMSDDDVKVVK